MSQTFTVLAAAKKKDVPDKGYGPMQVVGLTLNNGDANEPILAEWFTKATTPLPASGSTLEGDITEGQYGKTFKKAGGNFGGGGVTARGRDPKESAQIVQQHSQSMALRYAELQHARGKLPDNFNLEQILLVADKFAADAKAATP